MPETTLALYSDLTQRKLVDSTGSTVTLPPLFQGDTLVCTIKPAAPDPLNNNTFSPVTFNVRSLSATIGQVLAAPGAGQWGIKCADPADPTAWLATPHLDSDSSAAEVAATFNTAFDGPGWTATCNIPQRAGANVPGIWIVSLAGVASSPVTFLEDFNTLSPDSILRIQSYQDPEGNWYYEFRLIQSPYSWNDAGFQTVLAPEPTVTELLSGNAGTDSTPPQNAVQVLNWPENFIGTGFLQWNGYTSGVVSNVSGPSGIQSALNAMITDGSNPFTATVPADNQIYIEFGGEFAGSAQNLITFQVNTFAPGVLTFALPLDREELAAALRAAPGNNITAMLEITLEVVPDGADPSDPTVPGVFITLCQQSVTVFAKVGWDGLTALAPVNFLQPPSPTNYVPYAQNTTVTGQCHYFTVFSDGVHASYAIVHGLATVQLACPPMVAGNTLPAEILAYGLDFDATIDSINQVTLNFSAPPAYGALSVCITTAGPVSAFTIPALTIAQITGLQTQLNTLAGNISALQTLVPTGTLLGSAATSTSATTIPVPNAAFVVPGAWLPASFSAASVFSDTSGQALATLPLPPPLFREINASAVTTFSGALPSAPTVGTVYQNSGDPILLPGSAGRTTSKLAKNGYATWNGRGWYPLDRVESTNSFFPSDYNVTLSRPIVFDNARWQAGQKFTLTFVLGSQMVAANCSAEYFLVIEYGFPRSASTPAPTSPNLSEVDWYPVPLMTQRVVLTALAQSNTYGCQIFRSTKNVMTANKQVGTAIAKADACPLGPYFLLRARCIRLSVAADTACPVGYAAVQITNVQAIIQ